jgi:hypothetical protein
MVARLGAVIGSSDKKDHLANPLDGTQISQGTFDGDSERRTQDADGLFGGCDADGLRIRKGQDVLREGILEKRIVGKEITWAPRFVSLTKEALLFTVEAGGEIRDSVKLIDIARCGATQSNDHTLFLNGREDADNHKKGGTAMSKTRSFVGSFHSVTHSKPESADEPQPTAPVVSEWDHSLEICTERFGRTYYLRAETEEEKNEWDTAINHGIKDAILQRKLDMQLSVRRRFKLRLRRLVNSRLCQNLISLLLVINFVVNVYDAETLYEDGTQTRATLDYLDSAFTVIYFVELITNMYVHWFRKFFTNGWFVFDFIVVIFSVAESIVTLVSNQSSGGLAIIRMIRIFRIVRVFNKLKSLQRVILGISSTLLPMCNVVIVLLIFQSIFAILATRLFLVSYPEKFGSFGASSFTMFQVRE